MTVMGHGATIISLFYVTGILFAEPGPRKELPLPGEVFVVEGHTAFLIPAKNVPITRPKPWVWYAPTLPNLPSPDERWMFERFLDAGIAIAGIDAGESYGSPAGNKLYSALYAELTERQGYSAKPVLLGRSRGGLMTLSWGTEHPDQVGGFAGIYPVCNIASYPGLAKGAGAFELTPEELDERLVEFNPIDKLAGLAKAQVPLFAIHGDDDKVVPLDANSGLMKQRYTALGGTMELIVPRGQGHNMWIGFFQCPELVDFVKAHAGLGLVLESPRDYQVIQRKSKEGGPLRIRGRIDQSNGENIQLEYRLIRDAIDEKWMRLPASFHANEFQADIDAPSGGWYRLEVRAKRDGADVGAASVAHIGVGEVFVVAGQSNSANYGEEKQHTKTGKVSTFDGNYWRLAHDPQPGAGGEGGSFMPPLGDEIAARFRVPVGFVACGAGGTSVREWLPKGVAFSNPPTVESRVRKRNDDTWESRGDLFASFCERMKSLGPHGFRAVLWHQGESDAHQKDNSRTLAGPLYREYLSRIIKESRQEVGWNAPWFIAQVSYHSPDDASSTDIRNAQQSLWNDGVAMEGPDSDALTGKLRDSGGTGVHFSGEGLRQHASRWFEKIAPWLETQIK